MKNHRVSALRRQRSMAAWIAGIIAAALYAFPIAAAATRAYAVIDSRMLAGPGDDYPVVAQLDRGAAVDLNRCLPDYSWCNVSFGSNRGWVYGMVVSSPYGDNVNQLTSASYSEVPDEFGREVPEDPLAAASSHTSFCFDGPAED